MPNSRKENNRKILIYGAGGHARVVVDIIRQTKEYGIAGFLVDPEFISGPEFLGHPVLGDEKALPGMLNEGTEYAFVAFGQNRRRYDLTQSLQEKGFILPVLVHPSAVVADRVDIGPGSVVMSQAVVQPDCRIGEAVIINTSASIDHECILGDGVHVCPGAHLAGGVEVGRFVDIGIGASVIDKIKIGEGSKIGAGGIVIRDIPDHVTAVGVPARIIKHHR